MSHKLDPVKEHIYGGKLRRPGTPYEARNANDVKVMVALGNAKPAQAPAPAPAPGTYSTRVLEADQQPIARKTAPAKKTYRRRDQVAEE